MNLVCTVTLDEKLKKVSQMFDYQFDGQTITEIPAHDSLPKRDSSWQIGAIVGSSGTGKSTILSSYYSPPNKPLWDNTKAIVSQVDSEKLSAAGLNSIPSWCKPRHVLSTGEGFRADIAASLDNNVSLDEFTSVVDRNVAQSCSNSLQKYIRRNNLTGIVISSCHFDILEWLQPDWVFNTDTGNLSVGRVARQGSLIEIYPIDGSTAWPLFRKHHYLSAEMNKSSRCFGAFWNGKIIGMCSSLAYPSGTVKNAWREHRLVVLPDFQGFGIGTKLSDFVARNFVETGHRYFAKTAHPVLGEYRERKPNWKGTSKNKKARLDYKGERKKEVKNFEAHKNRICYSHEYIGGK